jgi:prepilin peptidase dependent protein B
MRHAAPAVRPGAHGWTALARRARALGVSLVELMVGLAIGAFIILLATSPFATQMREYRDLLARLQLNHDTRVALQYVTRQLRASHGTPDSPPVWTEGPTLHAIHDLPTAGSFGFRLSAGVLQARLGAGTWQALTDAASLEVLDLQLEIETVHDPLAGLCPHDCPGGIAACLPERSSRRVTVLLTARHRHLPDLVRTLTQSVWLRNDTLEATCILS